MSTRLLGRAGRASGLLLNVVPDGTRNPIVTGQAPTFARASVGGYTAGIHGNVSRTVHSQLKYEMVDLDGDGIRETMGLLLEPSRTNGAVRSQELGTGWSLVAATVNSDVAYAPDRTLTADKLAEDSTTNVHRAFQTTPTLTDSTYSTMSIYMKAQERSWAWIRLIPKSSGSLYCWFDLVNGVVGQVAGGARARIEKCADGWYRCIMSADALTGGTAPTWGFGPTTGDGVNNYAGTTGYGVLAWGAQFETDKAFATTYIPTVASTATKNADALTTTTAWPWQDVTMYAKVARPWWADVSGNLGQAFYLYWFGGGTVRLAMVFLQATRFIQVDLNDGTTGVATTLPIPAGAVVEICGQFVDLLTAARCRLDVGSGFGAYSTTVSALPAQTDLRLGVQNSSGAHAISAPIISLKIASGARTMAEMRGLV